MKALSQAVISLIVAFSFLAGGAAIPASSKTCPCCAKAEADDRGPASVHEPMGCCHMKGAAPSESVTLNTGVEEFHNYLTVRIDETAPSIKSLAREVQRPDYGRWAFESPPVYLLKSSLIC